MINLNTPDSIKFTAGAHINSIVWFFIGTIIIWLFWSATVLGIETGDGYSTIVTSQYFIGLNNEYGFQRGPLLSLYLIPAEWLSNYLNLHPLDVRPHHFLTALLHSIYIVATWLILKRYYSNYNWPVAAAYLAAIPSFVFFSYAVFISPDIFPGLILITMILLVAEFAKKSSLKIWLALIALGFIATTIKQTYAIFWISILFTICFIYSKKIVLKLVFAAIISGILSWLSYAWFLNDAFSTTSTWWIMRPLQQISFINDLYSRESNTTSDIFVWWLYIRNYYNYGTLAATLILPSLAYILFYLKSKDKTLKLAATIWIINIIFLQITPYKEVRYLEYLAPLTAFLLVPFFNLISRSEYKYYFISLIFITFTFDLTKNTNEALRLNNDFYSSLTQSYFKPLDDLYAKATFFNTRQPQVVAINHTGFTPNIFSPLKGDRYHRTFHLPNHALPTLYGFKNLNYQYLTITDESIIDKTNISYEFFNEGDILLFSNQNPVREPPWDSLNLSSLKKHYVQVLATAEEVLLTKKDGKYQFKTDKDDTRPLLLMNDKNKKFRISISNDNFTKDELSKILGQKTTEFETIKLTGFRVSRLCNYKGCLNMEFFSKNTGNNS